MKNLHKVAFFIRDVDESHRHAATVAKCFVEQGYVIDDEDYDLAVAVGGDGTFLSMVESCNFDEDVIYVGINVGTLGFLQEIKMEELNSFLDDLKTGNYKIDEIGIQETVVTHKTGVSRFFSLNEIVVRAADLKLTKANIYIDGDKLESLVSDGLIVATSTGSTAHNLSYGGSIVFDTFSCLQVTPMAPINSSVYMSLQNSLIVSPDKTIKIVPFENDDLIITIDGKNQPYDEVTSIETRLAQRKISRLRSDHHSFTQKVNEKLLNSRF